MVPGGQDGQSGHGGQGGRGGQGGQDGQGGQGNQGGQGGPGRFWAKMYKNHRKTMVFVDPDVWWIKAEMAEKKVPHSLSR